MSAYDNAIGGKLKLKGKTWDVKSVGVTKKKKHKNHNQISQVVGDASSAGLQARASTDLSANPNEEDRTDTKKDIGEVKTAGKEEHLTPADRRYIEQREKTDVNRMAKEANKSHRDRIQGFNQYLANMSEHYDIPKVGPG